jgi:hypothetical protein
MSATPPAQRVKLGGPVELAAVNRSGRPALCSISAIRAINRWWSPAVWTDPISQSIQARLPARIGVRLRGLGLHLAPTYLSALDLANDAGCSTCPPAHHPKRPRTCDRRPTRRGTRWRNPYQWRMQREREEEPARHVGETVARLQSHHHDAACEVAQHSSELVRLPANIANRAWPDPPGSGRVGSGHDVPIRLPRWVGRPARTLIDQSRLAGRASPK